MASLGVARIFALFCGALQIGFFFEVVRLRCGRFAAWCAVIFLVASSYWIPLSVSVLPEPMMVTLALASILMLFKYLRTKRAGFLVLSGIVMGSALQTKLTAIIFAPAMMCEFFRCPDVGMPVSMISRVSAAVFPVGFWFGSILLTVLAITIAIPGQSLDRLIDPHFSSTVRAAFSASPLISYRAVTDNWEGSVVTLIGILLVLLRRRWDLGFPVVLLFTVIGVHGVNRPYWYYYDLHFAIPLVWLASFGLKESLVILMRNRPLPSASMAKNCIVPVSLLTLVLSLSIAQVWHGIRLGYLIVSRAPIAEHNSVVRVLKDYREAVDWVFAKNAIYAFHAGIPVPPNLAIPSRKRFASREIDETTVIETLRIYRPGIIVLWEFESQSENWRVFLDEHYTTLENDNSPAIYVRTDVRSSSDKSINRVQP